MHDRSVGSAASPAAGLAQDRRAAIRAGIQTGVVAGALFGVAAGVAAGILSGVVAGAIAAVVVAVGACVVDGVAGSFRLAWPWFEMAGMWLALNHCLPQPLMDFLADSHRRGVLRQVGAVYQFRHIELQHRLANRDAVKQQADSPATPPEADE